MLLFTSNGLSSEAMRNRLKPLLFGLTKAVLVTTASVGYKENDWHIPRLKDELNSLGFGVDTFDFDSQNPKILLQYDVVEIMGGNPFYLLKSMKSANCGAVLKELAKTKMLIGISAGSVVLQKNIRLVAQYTPHMNDDVHLSDLTGFHLTDLEILPHYSKFLPRFEKFEERAREYEEKERCKVIRLNDGQGVLIEAGRYHII